MADEKVSALPSASLPLAGTELVYIVKAGADNKTTTQDIVNIGKQVSAASRILGRGAGSGSGPQQELTIDSSLQLTGTVLSVTPGSYGNAQTANPLSQFAATTSAQLAGVITDETGSGALVFANSPILTNPVVGTQSNGDNSTKAASTAFVQSAITISSGTVTSFAFTNGGGFTGTVANPTSTPALSLTYSPAFASLTTSGSGAATLSSGVLNVPTPVVQSLTTTGSGAATLSAGVLNIPTPTTSTGTVTSVAATGSRVTGTVTNPTTTPSIALALANTAVTAGSYTNANITVQADGTLTAASNGSAGASLTVTNVFTKNQSVSPVVVSSATGTYTPDASASNNFQLTLTGNLTLANPTNLTSGMVLNFTLDEDATGGRTITLGSIFKFPSGTVPTWVTTASAKNFISGYYDGTIIRCGAGVGYA